MQAQEVIGEYCQMQALAKTDCYKCGLDQPCPACVKACGNHSFGEALCIRQKLLVVWFASGDFYYMHCIVSIDH